MTDLYNLFPTPVIRVPADDINYHPTQREIQSALKIIDETNDTTSVTYLYKGKNETSISKKTYDFIEKFNCKSLEKRIYAAVNEYIDRAGWRGGTEFLIKNSWINIIEEGQSHTHHCHPGYSISGTYYYRVSSEQGSISFSNPNIAMMNCQFPQGVVSPQTTDIIPDDGDIILFPSWLSHTTRNNTSNEDRISIAFNIDYVGSNDIAFGLTKQSNAPYHSKEVSLKNIVRKNEDKIL